MKKWRWTQPRAMKACEMRRDGKRDSQICRDVTCTPYGLGQLFRRMKKAGFEVPRGPDELDYTLLGAVFEHFKVKNEELKAGAAGRKLKEGDDALAAWDKE